MSVLDRVRRTPPATATTTNGAPASPETSSSTRVPESVTAQRIKIVTEELIQFAEENGADSPFAGHLWVVKSLFGIFLDELSSADDVKTRMWLQQFSALFQWCSDGDASKLPPELQEFLHLKHSALLAIEA